MGEETQQLSEEDKKILEELTSGGYGSNIPDGKHNVHTFLHNVVIAEDTTKLGVLTEDELGKPDNPIRALKFMRRFSNDIMNHKKLGAFFGGQSEDITSTSLSRQGTLVKLAVTQKREMADTTKAPPSAKQKSNWFGSKDKKPEGESSD